MNLEIKQANRKQEEAKIAQTKIKDKEATVKDIQGNLRDELKDLEGKAEAKKELDRKGKEGVEAKMTKQQIERIEEAVNRIFGGITNEEAIKERNKPD